MYTIKIHNQDTQVRLHIKICKHKKDVTIINFLCYEKYNRKGCYLDTLFLDYKENSLYNQRIVAECILNDNILLQFFR